MNRRHEHTYSFFDEPDGKKMASVIVHGSACCNYALQGCYDDGDGDDAMMASNASSVSFASS